MGEEPIEVAWCAEGSPLDEEEVARIARAAQAHGGRGGGLSVVFLDDRAMAELHGEWLDDPTPTDVITFDLEAGDGGGAPHRGPVGELYVGLETARRVAAERGVPWARELALYVVHGVLHLCGYDDHDDGDRARMRRAERAVLDALGYPGDDAPHDA